MIDKKKTPTLWLLSQGLSISGGVDNVVANAGAGGATFASDDIAGVQYPRAKVVWGVDGTAVDTSASNPLPTDPQDRAARDNGKVDIVSLDQYTPQDVDSGAPVVNALPVVLKKTAAGAPDLGTSTDPMRVDPTGTTTQPVSGTVSANLNAGTNNIGDVDVLSVPAPLNVTGGGVELGALRVTLASDSTGLVSVDDNGGSLTVDGTVTANAGTGTFGTNVAQVGGTAIDTNSGNKSAGTPRVVLATDQPNLTTDLNVKDVPQASGGLSFTHLVSAASANATNVKASAGQVYCITAFNLNAAPRYLKFHNTSGTPTAGTGVVATFMIPGNTAGAGLVINIDKGLAFGTGIGITLVTGIGDADATAVAANEIVVNIGYK